MQSSQRKSALVSGIFLVFMAAAAAFSYGYAHGNLIAVHDAAATYHNLLVSRFLFAAELTGWIIIFLCDIIVALALFLFFRETDRKLSFLTASFRIVYAGILGIAIYQLIAILPLVLHDPASAGESLVMMHLGSFERIWSGGLILFGIHLLGLGYLSLRSEFVPRAFGWLLLFAGICYLLVHSAKTFTNGYEGSIETAEMILGLPMAIGEISFAIWLIIKGGKPAKKIYFNKQVG